jgi:hypothetical protein
VLSQSAQLDQACKQNTHVNVRCFAVMQEAET